METESEFIPWAIEVEGLSKSFGNNRALSDIFLKVNSGEHMTIFGPNGAGKTTLVKVLSTLSKPSTGTVMITCRAMQSPPRRLN